MTPPLLNAKELAARLGIGHSTFALWKKRGRFQMFETARPMGQRRYIAAKVDRYLQGESLVGLGPGSRSWDRRSA